MADDRHGFRNALSALILVHCAGCSRGSSARTPWVGVDPPAAGLTAEAERPASAVGAEVIEVFEEHAYPLRHGPRAGSEIVRHAARDVVAVYYQDTVAGEPSIGWLCVLDGETGKFYVRSAWDYAFTFAGDAVVYSAPHLVVDAEAAPPHSFEQAVARRIGVSTGDLKAAVFIDGSAGSSHAAQPVVLDLKTGKESWLPIAGGGLLATTPAGTILAMRRPWYWAFPAWPTASPSDSPAVLHPEPGILVPSTTEQDIKILRDRVHRLRPPNAKVEYEEPDIVARTKAGNPCVVIVEGGAAVAPARCRMPSH